MAACSRSFTSVLVGCVGIVLGSTANAADPVLLKGHSEVVYDSAFLPNGKALVTASFDRTLKLWDLDSKTPVRTMEGHTGIVLTVDVTKDGTLIASGASDNTIKLWDVPTNEPVKTLASIAGGGSAVAVSFDGKLYATGDETGSVRVWNAEDDKQIVEAKLAAGVSRLAWRRDGKQLAAGLVNGTLVVLNPVDGKLTGQFGGHDKAVTGLAFSTNNTQFYSAGADGLVKRWPTTPPKLIEGKKAGQPIHALAVHPNGTFIVAASQDGAHVLNRSNGTVIRSLEGLNTAVTAAAYSSNGSQVAVGVSDKTVRTFSPSNGKMIKQFSALPGAITAVAITPNLQTVIAADDSGAVKLFKAADASELHTLAGITGPTRALALWSNGSQLITGGDDKHVRLWAIATGKEVRKFAFDQPISALGLSANNTLLAVGFSDGTIRVINPSNGQQSSELLGHTKKITGLSFNSNQTSLVSSSDDGHSRRWDLKLGRSAETFVGHKGSVTGVFFLRDNRTVVTSGADGFVKAHQIANQMVQAADDKSVNGFALAANAASFATAGEDGSVKTWSASSGALIRSFVGFESPALAVALSADARQIAAGGKDGTVRTWTVSNGVPIFKLQVGSPVHLVEYSSDSKKLVAVSEDKTIRSFDPTPLSPAPAEPPNRDAAQNLKGHTDLISAIAWSPNNRTLRTIGKDKTVREWAIASAGFTASLTGHSSQVYSVAFSPDGKTLATGSNDKTIRLWDVETKKAIKSLPSQPAAVYGVVFSPDGTQLASAGADRTVRVFDIKTAREVKKFEGPEHALYSVAWSADGKRIAAAGMGIGKERAIYIWDKTKDGPQAVLRGHADDIYRVQFNAAGNRLLSVGYSGSLKIWDLGTNKPIFEQAIGAISYSARFSHDGKQLVTSSNDRAARLWTVPAQAQ